MSTHTSKCPAEGCSKTITREMAFCRYHWLVLPGLIQKKIWAEYTKGGAAGWAVAMKEAQQFLKERMEFRALRPPILGGNDG